jgi:hypothetical protein
VRSHLLESLGCWLKLSGGSHLPPGLPESPLVAAALDGLKVDGTFHAAVDAVSLHFQFEFKKGEQGRWTAAAVGASVL